jgi:phosphoglycolate phosphatase
MPYTAVLFDLDGTLLNTLEDIADSVNRTLMKMGFPTHELDAYRYLVGDGALMLISRALPEDKRVTATIKTCIEDFRKDYSSHWNIKTHPYKGIPELLDALKERGIKMGVLSNKPHTITQQCVTQILPHWRFDVVLGQKDSVPLKPDPSGALAVAQDMKISPSHFLYLGDTAIDMKTAQTVGMFPVGVLWGFRPEEELVEGGAKALIKQPLDLLHFLDYPKDI